MKPTSSEYREVYKKFDSRRAGYNGECNVDRHISKLSPTKDVVVLQDINLQINPNWFIQIDTLIITNKYILILEVKSYKGTLHFEDNPYALIQIVDDDSIVRRCPQLQALGYVEGLKEWLGRQGFTIPIYVNLVLGYPTAQVKTPPKLIQLIQAEEVPLRVRDLNRKMSPVLSSEEVHILKDLLRSANDPFLIFPLTTYYRIDSSKVRPGIICDKCGTLLSKHNHIYWFCRSCLVVSKDAPKKGIVDWLMIMQTTISNEECRTWLGLKDKYAASYLLRHSTLEKIGDNRARRYRFKNNSRDIPLLLKR